jgi:hypothetical protein
MQRANVFRLTNQMISLTEILPPDTLICLAPEPVKNFMHLSLTHLLEETRWLLQEVAKQPEFNALTPVYIILENTKNAWIASRMIEAAFARFNNDPKIWIIQGDFREFVDLQRFIVEGIDFAQTYEYDRRNQVAEYPGLSFIDCP